MPFPDTLEGLITCVEPPVARRPFVAADGGCEHKFTEGAVQLAYAAHLVRAGATEVHIHPDVQHLAFNFIEWLARYGFDHVEPLARRHPQAGWYSDGKTRIRVHIRGGFGDVWSDGPGIPPIGAECKGGTINSNHSGVRSQLRRRMGEAVGQALILDYPAGGRRVAVVPHTPTTVELAGRLARRLAATGVGIALIHRDGKVVEIGPV